MTGKKSMRSSSQGQGILPQAWSPKPNSKWWAQLSFTSPSFNIWFCWDRLCHRYPCFPLISLAFGSHVALYLWTRWQGWWADSTHVHTRKVNSIVRSRVFFLFHAIDSIELPFLVDVDVKDSGEHIVFYLPSHKKTTENGMDYTLSFPYCPSHFLLFFGMEEETICVADRSTCPQISSINTYQIVGI